MKPRSLKILAWTLGGLGVLRMIPGLFPAASSAGWWLSPIGIWALAAPLIMLFAPDRLPPFGEAPWFRRLAQWLAGEIRRRAAWIVVLTILSSGPILLDLFLHRTDLFRALFDLRAIGFAFAHLTINLGFVFLFRSHPFPAARTRMIWLAVEFAGRLTVWQALRARPWWEAELYWMMEKAILLSFCASLCEYQARRGLARRGIMALGAELGRLPWVFASAAQGPLPKLFPFRLSRLSPLLISLTIIPFNMNFSVVPFLDQDQAVFFPTLAAYLLAIAFFIHDAFNGIARLRQSNFLSSLLLTEIRAREILAIHAGYCLRPLVWVIQGHLIIMLIAHEITQPILSKAGLLLVWLALSGIALAAEILMLGPLTNKAMRSRNSMEAGMKVTGSLIGMEIAILLAILYIHEQVNASMAGVGGLGFIAIFTPHLLLIQWSLGHWQSLILDFEDLAHGSLEANFRALPPGAEVHAPGGEASAKLG